MLHRIAADRGVQASVVVGAGLAALSSTEGLSWPLWLVWAAVSGWAVVRAARP